ncbi:MAG: stalk domain-containing protein, partial [Peptoniphilus rhinitidis]|uniref:stalk domain-containing protein n=1 Tax=Peptoniphilus rhinitidis TaxID=1175452 RepID=UPI0029113980
GDFIKKICLFIITIFCCLFIGANVFANDTINNKEVLVPVRDFFEKSGYEVRWNAKTKDVYIIDEKENVIFVFGKETSKNNIILLGNKAYFNLKD